MLFPRLQKRGPIEAISAKHRCVLLARFHAYKSVAPLKRHAIALPPQPLDLFPRLQKRSLIEATGRARDRASATRCFHAYKSVAPLKPDRAFHRSPWL